MPRGLATGRVESCKPGKTPFTSDRGLIRAAAVALPRRRTDHAAMMRDSVAAVATCLHEARVRYLVVGGLAVNVHGYLRFTKDIDMVIALDEENVIAAFDALATLGFRPLVPVTSEQFADPANREEWVVSRNMQVLQLWSDRHPQTPVDLFVTSPFDFEAEYQGAMVRTLDGVPVRFVALPTLIRMKEAAGREQDRIDVEHLRLRLDGEP